MAQSASRTIANIGSPDARRRMAYAAARQRLRDGLLAGVLTDEQIEREAVDIAEQTGCSEYVAQRAVRTMIGGDLRDDAPVMPEAIRPALTQEQRQRIATDWTAEREAAYREALRPHVWPTGTGLVSGPAQPAPKPVQPLSYERPKRRIVLG